MSLQRKITIGFIIILALCLSGYSLFEKKIRNARDQVNDKIIVDIYEQVRRANELAHIKTIDGGMQKLARQDAIIKLASGNSDAQYDKLFKGLFLTMKSKLNLGWTAVLDKNLNLVSSEGDTEAYPVSPQFLKSAELKALCAKTEQTWATQGAMLSLGMDPVFMTVCVIVDNDDNTAGYLMGLIPAQIMARSLAKELAAHVVIQNSKGEYFCASDDEFLSALQKTSIANLTDDKASVLSFDDNSFLTYSIALTSTAGQENAPRYLVFRNYTKEQKSIFVLNMLRLAVVLVVLIVAALLPYLLLRKLLHPLNTINTFLRETAQGSSDLAVRLPVLTKDEIGDLSHWFNMFMDKLEAMIRDVVNGVETLAESSGKLFTISNTMLESARHTKEKAGLMSSNVEEAGSQMSTISSGITDATARITNVAQATEEMSATITTLTGNSSKTRNISTEAVQQVSTIMEMVADLGHAVKEIDTITTSITDISDQTNLLALNATIEAARAGNAGKGFAVVAGEIKDLAIQTADATEDIRSKVKLIQNSTENTIANVKKISDVMGNVNEIIFTITNDIEQHSTVIQDVAVNIAQASADVSNGNRLATQSIHTVQTITGEIDDFNQAALEITDASQQVQTNASALLELSEMLRNKTDQFKLKTDGPA